MTWRGRSSRTSRNILRRILNCHESQTPDCSGVDEYGGCSRNRRREVSRNIPRRGSSYGLIIIGNGIYLSSGLGMTYGAPIANQDDQDFDNVFVTPQAYKAFLATGTWPDKTMAGARSPLLGEQGIDQQEWPFPGEIGRLEIHLKDEGRFPASKWAFFGFNGPETTAKPLAADSVCQKCHTQNGAVDETFVQFYPTLIAAAKAKGTFKVTAEK